MHKYKTSLYFFAKIYQIDESLNTCVKLLKSDFSEDILSM